MSSSDTKAATPGGTAGGNAAVKDAPASATSGIPSSGGTVSTEKEPDVIVIDIGTGSIKAGWAGEDAPRVVIPTILLDHHGQAMPASVMDQHHMERNEYAVGHAALQALHLSSTRLANTTSNNLNLLRPVERGDIRDYDTVSKILDHIFKSELRVNPKDHPVMLTVSPLCSPESRAELSKLMFDVFNVPSLCMANQAVLSLYSTGRTTGVVLELGEGMTYCVPIYEGFALKHAVLSIPIAGGDLTKYLMKNLGERGFNFLDSQADTVRDIKEKLCRVRASRGDYAVLQLNGQNAATTAQAAAGAGGKDSAAVVPAPAASATTDTDETSYELPDGQMIRLDDFCRFHTLEILFAPEQYAQALGVNLTGGLNQSFGIPMQQHGVTGGLATSSGGGGGGASTNQPVPSSNLPPPTPSTASNPPGSANSQGGGSFAGAFNNPAGSPTAGAASGQVRQGPITIDLSTNELFGVHRMLHSSLGMVDSFLRRDLLKNIVLAGGTSMAKGFGERVKRELGMLLDASGGNIGGGLNGSASQVSLTGGANGEDDSSSSAAAGLNIITDSQRKFAAWIGASMYASLPTFSIIKVTSDQYKRDENIVHKKFF